MDYILCFNAEPRRLDDELYELLSASLLPYDGAVVVWMSRFEVKDSELVGCYSQAETPDMGTVLAAGPGVPLLPGQQVLCRATHGKHLSGFKLRGRQLDGIVRMYGRAATTNGGATRIPWWESVPVMLDGGCPRATHRNVVIDRGEIITESEGGILYTQDSTYRPTKGTVVSIGSMAQKQFPELREGATVYYLANSMLPLKGFKLGGEYKNYGVIDMDGILCEVVE